MVHNIAIPPKPLTRVMARAKSHQTNTASENENSGTNSPDNRSKKRSNELNTIDAYRMEVNEYIPEIKKNATRNKMGQEPFPCVTVRDMKPIIADRKQRRVWIPVTICESLVEYLRSAKISEDDTTPAGDAEVSPKTSSVEDENSTSEKKRQFAYDVSKLTERNFTCQKTGKIVEIEIVPAVDTELKIVRLRTYMDVPSKEEFKTGDFIEVIELRSSLVGRLIKFLNDVAMRYQSMEEVGDASIPSLYSYSGERRFYFDLRDTRWGLRLHISQVTDLHRNVIGIPLESVVQFRDRLNMAIEKLNLTKEEEVSMTENMGFRGNNRRPYRNNSEIVGRRGRNYRRGSNKQSRRRKRNQQEKQNPTSGDDEKNSDKQAASTEE